MAFPLISSFLPCRYGSQAGDVRLLIAEFMKEVSPLLPDPCHFQNNDQSMSKLSSGSSGEGETPQLARECVCESV